MADHKWGKPIVKHGIIITGGFGKPIDYYSEEAKEQRKAEVREKILKLQQKLGDIDAGMDD